MQGGAEIRISNPLGMTPLRQDTPESGHFRGFIVAIAPIKNVQPSPQKPPLLGGWLIPNDGVALAKSFDASGAHHDSYDLSNDQPCGY